MWRLCWSCFFFFLFVLLVLHCFDDVCCHCNGGGGDSYNIIPEVFAFQQQPFPLFTIQQQQVHRYHRKLKQHKQQHDSFYHRLYYQNNDDATTTETTTSQTKLTSSTTTTITTTKWKATSNAVYKHLYRNYDDISFDSFIRCMNGYDFLLSIGYTQDEIENNFNRSIVEQDTYVHSQLAPKVRFIIETLKGGTGQLTWEDEYDHENHYHNMHIYDETKQNIPSIFWNVSCRLDRLIGPRHAYLQYHQSLPSNNNNKNDNNKSSLLEQPNLFERFLLTCTTTNTKSLSEFVVLCNELEQKKIKQTKQQQQQQQDRQQEHYHTVESVQQFEQQFGQGLIPFVKKPTKVNTDQMISLLLQHGSNYLDDDQHGIIPFHWAASTNKLRAVQLLLQSMIYGRSYGGNVPSDDDDDDGNRSDVIVDILLQETGHVKDDATAFHWACCGVSPSSRPPRFGIGGCYDTCRYLLEQTAGCTSNKQMQLVNAKTRNGNTPLMWTVWGCANDSSSNTLRIVDLLLVNGADTTIHNKYGQNVVHWGAAAGCSIDILSILYEHARESKQANLFLARDHYGKKPYDYAQEYNHEHIMNWMQSVFGDTTITTNNENNGKQQQSNITSTTTATASTNYKMNYGNNN